MPALQTPARPLLADAIVGQVCSRRIVTCPSESRLTQVAAAMTSHAVHAAVITATDGGRPLVVTDLDLIRAALGGDLSRDAGEIACEPMATVDPSAPLTEAVAILATRELAHVLVAAAGAAELTGVLSSLDVAAVVGGRDPALTRTIRPGPARPLVSATALSGTTVGAVMHPGVVYCSPSTPLSEVAGTMADLRVHCVAVAGVARHPAPDQHLMWGLVSAMDVVHAAHRGELDTQAHEVAATAPLALSESAGLDQVAVIMAGHGATHVVAVGRSGMPSGMVSTLDVLRIFAAA